MSLRKEKPPTHDNPNHASGHCHYKRKQRTLQEIEDSGIHPTVINGFNRMNNNSRQPKAPE